MFIILSPAKRMAAVSRIPPQSRPQFMAQAACLADILKGYAPGPLAAALKTSPALALRAYMDYQDMDLTASGAAALFAYQGLVFSTMRPDDFSADEVDFSQNHLRILSGLYGLLRPLDGILPHRLEMGCRLPEAGGSLYDYWADRLYQALFAAGDTVVNLASAEYARAVTPYLAWNDRMITCEFYTLSRGRYRVMATAAKMARGAMARYAISNRIDRPEGLQGFDSLGYRFSPERSTDRIYRFYQQ